jgi:hypothetical protein
MPVNETVVGLHRNLPQSSRAELPSLRLVIQVFFGGYGNRFFAKKIFHILFFILVFLPFFSFPSLRLCVLAVRETLQLQTAKECHCEGSEAISRLWGLLPRGTRDFTSRNDKSTPLATEELPVRWIFLLTYIVSRYIVLTYRGAHGCSIDYLGIPHAAEHDRI